MTLKPIKINFKFDLDKKSIHVKWKINTGYKKNKQNGNSSYKETFLESFESHHLTNGGKNCPKDNLICATCHKKGHTVCSYAKSLLHLLHLLHLAILTNIIDRLLWITIK